MRPKTINELKAMCIATVAVVRQGPRVGPDGVKSTWPGFPAEYRGELVADAKGVTVKWERTRVIVQPSARQILEADTFTAWVAQLPEHQRHDIWQYGLSQVRRYDSIARQAAKRGMASFKLQRIFRNAFIALAHVANGNAGLRSEAPVADGPEIRENVSSSKPVTAWNDGFTLRHDPEHADHRSLVKRMMERQRQRAQP
jgi:hypothetical protein